MARYPVRRSRPSVRALLIRLPAARAKPVANAFVRSSRDWLGNVRTNMLAWWVPHAAMLATLFLSVPIRAVVWTVALICMGSACILNARQCGRTHCRYTGPYYLAMIIPVLVIASSGVSASFYGWIVLGVVIVAGSGIIWWATERAWGKFS
jgi:hypothetical protein